MATRTQDEGYATQEDRSTSSGTIEAVGQCWLLAVVLFACGRVGFDYGSSSGGDGGARDADDANAPVPDAAAVQRFAYLKASNTEPFDQFGYVIALSADGQTLAVGAPIEDGPANSVAQSGSVYVFARSGATWVQQAYVRPAVTDVDDQFGISLALSADGSTLAVGADGEDSNAITVNGNAADNSTNAAGAAYVFVRSGTTWSQQAYVKAGNSDALDQFGFAIALSDAGDVLAVGAHTEDSIAAVVDGNAADNTSVDSGAVYTFTRTGTVWSPQSYLKASNNDLDDRFGSTVALSGDGTTLVVGSPNEDSGTMTIGGNQSDDTVSEAGAAYVFVRAGATWAQQEYIKPSTLDFGDFFSRALSISTDGNTLAVASPGDDSVAPNSGAVFIFVRAGVTWTQLQRLKAANAGDNDQFGVAVALAGNGSVVMIGAPYEDSNASGLGGNQTNDLRMNSGAVFGFARSGGIWSQESYAKPSAPTSGDELGNAVAISSDGTTRALAAHYEDSAATTINGDAFDDSAQDSGAVELYYFGQ